MSQNRYTQGICSIWVDAADIFAVQHDGVVAQKISVMADVFQFDSPLRDNFFWVPGLIAANYSIGSIDYRFPDSPFSIDAVVEDTDERVANIQNTVVYTFLTARGRDSAAREVFLHLPRF